MAPETPEIPLPLTFWAVSRRHRSLVRRTMSHAVLLQLLGAVVLWMYVLFKLDEWLGGG